MTRHHSVAYRQKIREEATVNMHGGTYLKCTKCGEMVWSKELDKHIFCPVQDLKNEQPEASGAIELAFLRGKQSRNE